MQLIKLTVMWVSLAVQILDNLLLYIICFVRVVCDAKKKHRWQPGVSFLLIKGWRKHMQSPP